MIKNYMLTFYFKENNLIKKVFDYGDSIPLKILKKKMRGFNNWCPSTNKLINIDKFC